MIFQSNWPGWWVSAHRSRGTSAEMGRVRLNVSTKSKWYVFNKYLIFKSITLFTISHLQLTGKFLILYTYRFTFTKGRFTWYIPRRPWNPQRTLNLFPWRRPWVTLERIFRKPLPMMGFKRPFWKRLVITQRKSLKIIIVPVWCFRRSWHWFWSRGQTSFLQPFVRFTTEILLT